MTYDDIINDQRITHVVLRPSPSEALIGGITVLSKDTFSGIHGDAYVFEKIGGINDDIVYMVRQDL